MYTISIRSDDQDRYIGHRGTLGDAQALAAMWAKEAMQHQITHVFIAQEGKRIETICTGYQK